MSEKMLAQISQTVEAWNSGDLSKLDQVFSEDVIYHVPPFGDYIGFAAYIQFVQATRGMYPDIHVDNDEMFIQGDAGLLRWTCSATFSGPSNAIPIPPTGKFGKCPGMHVLHWKDGKIVEAWHMGDWLGLLTQQGVVPQMA
jgi:steroid delta-isomerase-like uncharacterized protein